MTELENSLFQQIAYVCVETKQAFTRYIGMSQSRTQLLTFVSRTGDISHAMLQQELSLDGATVTRLVKQFEAEGILTRRLDPQDNRYTLVSLTPAGKQLMEGLTAAHSDFQTRLLEGINQDEQKVMIDILSRLRSNLQTVEQEAASVDKKKENEA